MVGGSPPPGPLEQRVGGAWAGLIGAVGTPLYAWEVARRNRAFDAGRGVVRLDRPVLSVGNLSVGGTGKTPMVTRLVGELMAEGRRPCIAMRGYVPRGGVKAGHARSDEASEYARVLPGVPIVAQPDRAAGLRALFSSPAGAAVDCVVLDDGFQHRRIARDVDIVLIDATAGTLRDRLLPSGWLREPLESLRRAHAVVVTHAELAADTEPASAIVEGVRRINPALVTAVCRHEWEALEGDGETKSVEWLRGRRVLAVCAIGNPGAFLRAVRGSGAEVAGEVTLPDHDPYGDDTVRRIVDEVKRARAKVVVCTGKDWSKLEGKSLGVPVVRPRLRLGFDEGWEALWGVVKRGVGIDG